MESSNGKMAIELSKGRRALCLVALLLLAAVVNGEMAIMAITYNIYDVFGVGFVSNYFVSAPAFWMALAALACAWLMRFVTKKRLLVAGSAIFGLSATFCVASVNPVYVCVMRSLMGIGEGIVNTVAMAYIMQMYLDEGKRASVTGYFNAAMTVAGVVLSYAAGYLAANYWADTFRVYAPMLGIVATTLLFLPEIGLPSDEGEVAAEKSEAKGSRERMGGLFLPFIINYVLFSCMVSGISFFISVYVAENGIGDEILSGTLVSAFTAAGFVSAMAFGPIYAKLKKRTAFVATACVMIALAMLVFTRSVALCFAACIIDGIACNAYFAYSYAYPAEIVPVSRQDDAMSYVTAVYAITYSLISFLVMGIAGAFFGGAVTPVFGVFIGFGAVVLVIELATDGAYRRLKDDE